MAFLTIFAWTAVAVWLTAAIVTVYCLARQKFLTPATDGRLLSDDVPLVSILVPARNEARRILAESISSAMGQDYRRIEIIAVDDCSTDSTRLILQTIAKSNHQLKLVAGTATPSGWLGKPWALQQGLERSKGEWILATDADMIFEPTALRSALSYALDMKYDVLSLIPRFETCSFWERVFIPTWAWRMLIMIILGGVNDPGTRQAKAMGGFFLTRRVVLDRFGGYHGLKAEIVEDVRLAEALKSKGARVRIEYAPSLISTRMYSSLTDLWESCSRNWFALLKFSFPAALALIFATLALAIAPPLLALSSALFILLGVSGALPGLCLLGAIAWGLQVILLGLICWRHDISPMYALATPLGFALQCTVLINSIFKMKAGRGVTWKGRTIDQRLRR